MTIDYNKHQVLVRGENVHLTLSEFRIVALLGKFAGKVLPPTITSSRSYGDRAPAVTTRSCASIWPISAARSRKILPNRSICLPRSAWDIVWQRIRIIENGEWKMENVAILARVPSALRRGTALRAMIKLFGAMRRTQFSILHYQFSILNKNPEPFGSGFLV